MPFCAKLFGKKECFMKNYYVPVRTKFILAHICAILWLLFVKYLIIPTRFFKLFHQHLCCKIPCVYNILSF